MELACFSLSYSLLEPNRSSVRGERHTGRLKIYDPAFQFSKSTSPDFSLHHNVFKGARGDVTTGVTAPSLTGVEGEQA